MNINVLELTLEEAQAILSDERLILASREEVLQGQAAIAKRDALAARVAELEAHVERLRGDMTEAADVIRRQGRDPGTYYPRNFDEKQVLAIADHHGYGNLMALLASRWYDKVRGGAFSVGECVSTNASLARRLDAALASTPAQSLAACKAAALSAMAKTICEGTEHPIALAVVHLIQTEAERLEAEAANG